MRWINELLGRIASAECKDAACCYRRSVSVCLSVCLSVRHNHEPLKNGWTDQDVVRVMNTGRPKEPCLIGGPDPPGKGEVFFAVGAGVVSSETALERMSNKQYGAADLSAGTASHGESAASEWTRPPRGRQVRGRCGLSSKFVRNLLTKRPTSGPRVCVCVCVCSSRKMRRNRSSRTAACRWYVPIHLCTVRDKCCRLTRIQWVSKFTKQTGSYTAE